MSRLEYTFKTDTLFKMLFVKYTNLLKHLVSELLGIRLESIEEFIVTNPEMPAESIGDKFCRLDINMTVNRLRVDLEIQVRNEKDYPERVLFNWARLYSTALPAGGDYKELPRTVVISIINFDLFECEGYYSEFQPLEVKRHTALTDKMVLYFFELNKVPEEVGREDMRLLWLSLFRADTDEELKKIKLTGVAVMEQAVDAYYQVAASPEFRERQRLWEMARHNEAAALRNARDEERAENTLKIARKMKATGEPVEKIQLFTDLPRDVIEEI